MVLATSTALLEQIPKKIVSKKSQEDDSPLTVVLLQEMDRYNQLLGMVSSSLSDLCKGIQGLMVITPELEAVFTAVYNGKVPLAWKAFYPSLKPLGTWMRDLTARIAQLESWSSQSKPRVFWLGGFTFPTGFLTALMQTV